MFNTVHRTLLGLGTTIKNFQQRMRKASVVEKQGMQKIIATYSFVAKAFNAMFERFGYQKQLEYTQIMTSMQEMQQILMLSPELEAMYHVYYFGGAHAKTLFSSNACKMELQFEYPEEMFKRQKEELHYLTIKTTLEAFLNNNVYLLNDLETLLNACKNLDDVEYLARTIVN